MKLLVVPDIHEDLVFLQSILSEEDLDSFDHVVLLGDYFDPRGIVNPDLDNLRRVAETLLSVKQQLGERLHMLCGNHDLPYYALRPVCRVGSGKPNTVIAQWLESTTLERAEIINDVWDDLFWRNLKGAVLLDGWLFSHAGIHPDYWPKGLSGPLDAYERFQQHWRDAMATLFGAGVDPIFAAGVVRGGEARYGGPLWLDWDYEFVDALELPQIVGHTRIPKQPQIGCSFCVDMGQSAYAIVENGEVKIKQREEGATWCSVI